MVTKARRYLLVMYSVLELFFIYNGGLWRFMTMCFQVLSEGRHLIYCWGAISDSSGFGRTPSASQPEY